VQTILTAPPPWSPTVVAVAGQDVHVPAYLHTASDMRREGIPHVRKIAKSEAVSTLAGNTRK
jgi:hypothetical protein